MTLLRQLNPNPDAPTASGVCNRMAYTNTRWRECVIWCAMSGGGVRETLAQVVGAMAVHRGIGKHARGYAVTHIPTGRFVELYILEENALALAERLTALGDWNTRSPAKLKRLKEAM